MKVNSIAWGCKGHQTITAVMISDYYACQSISLASASNFICNKELWRCIAYVSPKPSRAHFCVKIFGSIYSFKTKNGNYVGHDTCLCRGSNNSARIHLSSFSLTWTSYWNLIQEVYQPCIFFWVWQTRSWTLAGLAHYRMAICFKIHFSITG